MESEHISVTIKPAFSQDDKSREGQDLKKKKRNKKLNKLRSIKLSKYPSLRPSTRRAKSHLRNIVVDVSSDTETSPYSTSSYQFSTNVSQKSAPPLIRRSSFKKGVKSLTRMSSKKQKKPLVKMSKTESDRSSVVSSSGSSRSVNSSSAQKMKFQASPRFYEHSFSTSGDRPKRMLVDSKKNSISLGQKSARTLTKKASLRPARVSTKSRRVSVMKHGEIVQITDSGVERATCSSALKDSKLADSLQVQHDGAECEVSSGMKVCPFSYCSLHGHRHANVPPLQRLISIRRRLLRNERSKVVQDRAIRREKRAGKAKKGDQGREKISCNEQNEGERSPVEVVRRDFSFELSTEMEAEASGGLGSHGKEEKEVKINKDPVGDEEKPYSFSFAEKEEEEDVAIKHEDEGLNSVCDEHSENNSASVGEYRGGGETTTATEQHDEYAVTRSQKGSSSESLSELENEQAGADKEEKENLEPERGTAQRMQLKDQKYVRMWRLMYKHTVKGVAGKVENPIPLDEVDRNVLIESNSSRSLQGSSEEDQERTTEQTDAVKLVQQAFDEILLPEIQEFAPDDRSVTSGLSSDQEVLEQGQVEGEEENIEEAKTTTTTKVGDKAEQKVSKSWSSLKKIFILKKFVRALDKVKRINRGTPRCLSLQPEPEPERVNLRRQTSEERKNAEEWMLDYALQQVVSKLDPAQQRRVVMLVKAFETVLPLPDLKSSPRLSVADRARVDDPAQACCSLLAQNGDKTVKETDVEGNCTNALVGKTSSRGGQVSEFLEADSEAADKEQEEEQSSAGNVDGEKSSEVIACHDQLDSISDKLDSDEASSTCHEAQQKENAQGVTKQICVRLSAEPGKAVDESYEEKKFESNAIDTVTEKRLVSSDSIREEENGRAEPEDTQLEKQSYMRLWGFVYKHMMANIVTEEDETKPDDESDGKPADNVKAARSLPIKDRDLRTKSDAAADNQKAVLRRIEAIKLIEKAIDDVILPDNQDSLPESQATSSSDEEPQAEKLSSHPIASTSESSRELGEEEEEAKSTTLSNQDEQKSSLPEKKMSSNWSNLKRMILLKRFIKALENARKFNPRGPRFLALEADAEAEKVSLKHQEMDERKNAEEWMLDYALQQAVARLTPARKRKVKLLVEAFETVTPTVRA